MDIISDISALQFWRCPPPLAEAEVPAELACAPAGQGGAGIDPGLLSPRANARHADRLVAGRILTGLKGLDLPVRMMVDGGSLDRTRGAAQAMRRPSWVADRDIVPLGGGLAVLSPAATLGHLASSLPVSALLILALEMLGIYAVHHETPLTRLVMNELLRNGNLSREAMAARPDRIFAFRDALGRPEPMVGRGGKPIPWEPCFDRFGRPTGSWKRPPLLTCEEFSMQANRMRGARGGAAMREVAALAQAGSASWLETRCLLLTCLGTWKGGEGWPWPVLNQRIDFGPELRMLSGQGFCVADQLWEGRASILEVNGEANHADSLGFKVASNRTPALEHLGYRVCEITYDQLANLEKYDIVIAGIAKRLDLPLQRRTPAFLKRRDRLHRELFTTFRDL